MRWDPVLDDGEDGRASDGAQRDESSRWTVPWHCADLISNRRSRVQPRAHHVPQRLPVDTRATSYEEPFTREQSGGDRRREPGLL